MLWVKFLARICKLLEQETNSHKIRRIKPYIPSVVRNRSMTSYGWCRAGSSTSAVWRVAGYTTYLTNCESLLRNEQLRNDIVEVPFERLAFQIFTQLYSVGQVTEGVLQVKSLRILIGVGNNDCHNTRFSLSSLQCLLRTILCFF